MKTYRALLVGAGGMGQAWARNLHAHPDVEISGWVDAVPGAAQAASDKLHLSVPHTKGDLAQALSAVSPDFVVDVTPPAVHHAVTLQSLEAGVPVLGEKPMADSMAQAREMVAASESSGKLYMVSQSRRYDGRLSAFRSLINKDVGPLGILNSDFYLGPHFGGFRDEMENPLVLDMAIHTFDAARYLCGSDAVSVYCDEWNPAWSWYKGDVCATAIFEMANGLRYTYRGSWCAEGRPTSWEAEWRAVGPQGTAVWDGDKAPEAAVVTTSDGFFHDTEARTIDVDPTFAGGIAGSLNDFLHALETGEAPMGECHDNIKSLAMVFAAMESSRTGQKVRVEG